MSDMSQFVQRSGAIFERMGVAKAPEGTHTTSSLGSGEFMNRKQVNALLEMTVARSRWLGAASVLTRNQRSGEIPKLSFSEPVTRKGGEDVAQPATAHGDTDHIDYACQKATAVFYLSYESNREAAASGENALESKLKRGVGKAMGNDLARLGLNGDATLPATSKMNMLLRTADGWLKQARNGRGIVRATTRGSAYSDALWPWARTLLPSEYVDDEDIRWMIPRVLDDGWMENRAGDSVSSELRDRALSGRQRIPIRGIPQLIVPQMPEDQGFGVLLGSAVDADSVTAPGGNSIDLVVDTLFGGFSADHVGRLVRVTFEASGVSAIGTVRNDGGTLKVLISGTLGQDTPSTTASAYSLDLADNTSVMLTNPANLGIVMCDKVRAYRKWEQERERWRFDVHYEVAFVVFEENALVLVDGIVPPQFAWGE